MPPAPGQRRAGVREDPRTVSRGPPAAPGDKARRRPAEPGHQDVTEEYAVQARSIYMTNTDRVSASDSP